MATRFYRVAFLLLYAYNNPQLRCQNWGYIVVYYITTSTVCLPAE